LLQPLAAPNANDNPNLVDLDGETPLIRKIHLVHDSGGATSPKPFTPVRMPDQARSPR
jgi:hypothetical protein